MQSSGRIGFVEAIVIDVSDLETAASFWSNLMGCNFGPSVQPRFLHAELDSGLNLVLQQVAESKVAKNRVHIDIEVEDFNAALNRVNALGGRLIKMVDNGQQGFAVCADPDGNEFCIGLSGDVPVGQPRH